MMNFNSILNKLSAKGFRQRGKSADDSGLTIIDYEHPKRNDMYALFVDEFGSVVYIEQTKIKWSDVKGRYVPVVEKIKNLSDFIKFIG